MSPHPVRAILLILAVLHAAFQAAASQASASGKSDPAKSPATLVLDLGGGVKLELVRIPAGKFTMGLSKAERTVDDRPDEHLPREATIPEDFYLGKFEVTRGQYRRFIEASGHKSGGGGSGWNVKRREFDYGRYSWDKPGFEQTDEHPAVCIPWRDAVAFCKWLAATTGREARLPTDAEWEYACRAGTTTRFSWGDKLDDAKTQANLADRTLKARFNKLLGNPAWDDGFAFTGPVGSFKPNAFGLHDMHGNATEWCNDPIPPGPGGIQWRIARGGGFLSIPDLARSGFQLRSGMDEHHASYGLRVWVAGKTP